MPPLPHIEVASGDSALQFRDRHAIFERFAQPHLRDGESSQLRYQPSSARFCRRNDFLGVLGIGAGFATRNDAAVKNLTGTMV